MVRLSSFI